ncbi:unnamed protein product [Heterobilharzia americana]|nr:unnamed protein product [Heterobilharzia americana]CAH8435948.1 unnamed protein product [Heterobilharzia americana]
MVTCNPRLGKYMACYLLYRGNVNMKEINKSIIHLEAQSRVKFVDWYPTGFKFNTNIQLQFVIQSGDLSKVSRSVCMVSSSTAVAEA